MSHCLTFRCPRCHHLISTGWTEPGLSESVFCGSCDASLSLEAHDIRTPGPPEGLRLYAAPPPPRKRRHRHRPPPPTVTQVPLREEIHTFPSGEECFVWLPDLGRCPCPLCGGRLHTLAEAAACCLRCGEGPMQEEDLF